MLNVTIENQLYLLYSSSWLGNLANLPEDYNAMVQIMKAKAPADYAGSFTAKDSDIYYAYLRQGFLQHLDVLRTAGNVDPYLQQTLAATWTDDIYQSRDAQDALLSQPTVQAAISDMVLLRDLDNDIAVSMYKDGYDYSRIIRVLANSARSYLNMQGAELSKEERMNLATQTAVQAVNPVVSMPNIAMAKPLQQIDLGSCSWKELYESSLKHVLDEEPSLYLYQADEKVVKLLQANGLEEKEITECIKNSFELSKFTEQELSDFISRAQHSEQKEAYNLEAEDAEIEKTVYTNLRVLLANEKMRNIQKYWTDALREISDSISYVKKAEYGAKIMRNWALGFQKAAKEMNVPMPDGVKKVYDTAQSIIQKMGLQEDDVNGWTAYFDTYDKMYNMTNQFATDIVTSLTKNPLLRIPEIATAKPLHDTPLANFGSPQALYCSAIKEAVVSHPGIGIYEADKLACEEMKSIGVSQGDIKKALAVSPRLEYLPAAKKRPDVESLMKYIEKGKLALKEGGR